MMQSNKNNEQDTALHISVQESILISDKIRQDPNMTLETLDAIIENYKKDLENEEKRYMAKMNDIHFERSLTEKTIRHIDSSDNFKEKIRTITNAYEFKVQNINSDLVLMYKIRQVYIELYPPS